MFSSKITTTCFIGVAVSAARSLKKVDGNVSQKAGEGQSERSGPYLHAVRIKLHADCYDRMKTRPRLDKRFRLSTFPARCDERFRPSECAEKELSPRNRRLNSQQAVEKTGTSSARYADPPWKLLCRRICHLLQALLKIGRNQALIFDNQNLLFARPLLLSHNDVLVVLLALGESRNLNNLSLGVRNIPICRLL